MINYYEILGLKIGAGSLEIKTAFRRLAKLYHPDKNPAGKDHFTKILKAYEVLSDPVLKAAYDYKLNYHSALQSAPSKASGTKTWSFDEKELKRRQYYNEHIKKYARTTESFGTEPVSEKTYNEYKYVLFATPIAVALFLLVMKLAAPSGIKHFTENSSSGSSGIKQEAVTRHPPQTGDELYAGFFGGAKTQGKLHGKLKVTNKSGTDIILCVFNERHLVCSSFVSNGAQYQLGHLPEAPVIVKYSSGLNFDPEKRMDKIPVMGTFTGLSYFYTGTVNPVTMPELVVQKGTHKGFEEISAEEFFKKDL